MEDITIEFMESLISGCKCKAHDCYDCHSDRMLRQDIERMKKEKENGTK